ARYGGERDGLVHWQVLALGLFLAALGSLLLDSLLDHVLAALGRLFGADRGHFLSRRFGRHVLGGSFLGRRLCSCLCGFLGLRSLGGPFLGALLGLLARFGLLRIVARSALLDARGIEEAGDAVGRLRTDAEPVAHSILVELHARSVILGEERIISADLLEIFAVARAARVRHHDAIIRPPLVAAPRKPDCYCHETLPFRFNLLKINSF